MAEDKHPAGESLQPDPAGTEPANEAPAAPSLETEAEMIAEAAVEGAAEVWGPEFAEVRRQLEAAERQNAALRHQNAALGEAVRRRPLELIPLVREAARQRAAGRLATLKGGV